MSIRVANLVAGYRKDAPILKGVSLNVADRSITTVIGPNGSGKSTLLKALMGLATSISGQIDFDGEPVQNMAVHRRVITHHVAYVPQLANVFGPLTILENLDVGGASLSRHQRSTRIAELFETYPALAGKRRSRADSLSGGQRQLLALARALMTSPQTLLLDEPSAGLSPVLAEELFAAIAGIRDQQGVTVLLVEQNAVQSLEISDVGLVLVDGTVAIQGSAADILTNDQVGELYLGGLPAA